MNENSFRFFLIVVSVVQTVISIRYLRRAGASATIFRRREEGIILSVTIAVFYFIFVASVLVYYIDPLRMTWSSVELPQWLRWLGAIPTLLGAFMILAGLQHLGINLTISISTKQKHALIDTGPYRWVRHPLYTGGMVESAGVCLLMANWFVATSALMFWTLIVVRTPMEEAKLIEQFGIEYREYARRVGRFVPRGAR